MAVRERLEYTLWPQPGIRGRREAWLCHVMMARQMEARRSHSSGRGNAFHCAFPSGASGVGEARGLT